ncbi:hypothetical protein N9C06_02685 [Salibacteraceae bacterium]|jgi:uncharacterized protein involved in exopolysaccharide biosynthesis|nr:hypothetical protein [Salibacteraceae bacterium]
MNTSNQSEFDSSNLLVFLLKWRKPLVIVSLSAALISAVVSFIVPEQFLSTVIFFPANTASISKAVMTEDVTGKNDIVAFGEEEQAEQMLQILYSDFIRDRVIEKFDLMAHYEIDLDDQYKLTSLIKEWESKVKFKRTEYQSIRIDVLDTDPQMAADIANEIARLVDVVKNRMQKDRAAEALKVIESEYTKMRDHMKAVDDSLTFMRKQGVHEYEKQIEMISGEYYKAIASGNAQAATKLEQKLDTLAKYGSAFIALTDNSEYERERLILLRSKFEETKVDATEDVPHKFIVNQAWASEKKAYPIRWLVVVISTFSAFLFAVLAIIVIENYRKLQEQNVA